MIGDGIMDKDIYIYTGWWFHPSENMSSLVGMMKFPTEWKNKNMCQTTNQHIYIHIHIYIYIYISNTMRDPVDWRTHPQHTSIWLEFGAIPNIFWLDNESTHNWSLVLWSKSIKVTRPSKVTLIWAKPKENQHTSCVKKWLILRKNDGWICRKIKGGKRG